MTSPTTPLTEADVEKYRAELKGNWDHELTPPQVDALCDAARAHLSAGGKTPLSNIMGSLWHSAEDQVIELAWVLQTIATEPVNWNTTDHHYYARIVGRFQLSADAALKASAQLPPSGEEQKEDEGDD